MTNPENLPLEHDSNEDTVVPVKGKVVPEVEAIAAEKIAERRDRVRDKMGMRPWLHIDNPEIWNTGNFNDFDD